MRRAFKIIVPAAAIVLPMLFVVLRTAHSERQALRPPRSLVVRPAQSPEFAGMRDVVFFSTDNVTLKGWYVPARNGAAVLFVHGYGANRSELLPEARLLARHGYGVLLFDSRAHGDSGGDLISYGDLERQDVRAAVDFLIAQPEVEPGRIGALGFSAGAAAVVLEAVEDPRVRAIALEAPATSLTEFCEDEFGRLSWLKTWPTLWSLSASGVNVAALEMRAAASKLAPRPLLVVHGDADPTVPLRRGQQLFAAAGQPKQLLIVNGAKHGGYAEVNAPLLEQALTALFDTALVQH